MPPKIAKRAGGVRRKKLPRARPIKPPGKSNIDNKSMPFDSLVKSVNVEINDNRID